MENYYKIYCNYYEALKDLNEKESIKLLNEEFEYLKKQEKKLEQLKNMVKDEKYLDYWETELFKTLLEINYCKEVIKIIKIWRF